jgi:hypothetical protein
VRFTSETLDYSVHEGSYEGKLLKIGKFVARTKKSTCYVTDTVAYKISQNYTQLMKNA